MKNKTYPAFSKGRGGAVLLIAALLLSACEMVPLPLPTPAVGTQPAANPTGIVSSTSTLPPATPTVEHTSTSVPLVVPSFPDSNAYDWLPFVSGLIQPVDIQNAGDGSGRLFVVEKPGRILIIREGQMQSQPFLDIQGKVGSQESERGLLGLAFHPNYPQPGQFFVNYTDLNGDTVIARFNVSADNPDLADPASELDLIHVDQPYANHNGGVMAFGPDGYLYIGLGDGGSGGDPQGNGQNLQTMLGKILRIDINSTDGYSVPADNPFANGSGLGEIWSYGLRNPWRFSFDTVKGDFYIADVGQNNWEEVDFAPAGAPGGFNYGWNIMEGTHPFGGQPPANTVLVSPVAEYSHNDGCSVTGGYVYRGDSMPEWQGVYLYGDYCSGNIWGLIHSGENDWQSSLLFHTSAKISTFGVDEAGDMYLADLASGNILRLSPRP
jgi:glucose/arabinose dehydrogenase